MMVMGQECPDEGSVTGTDCSRDRHGSLGHPQGRWPVGLSVSLGCVWPHCAFPPLRGPAASAFSPFFQPRAPAPLSLLPLVLCRIPGNCDSSPSEPQSRAQGRMPDFPTGPIDPAFHHRALPRCTAHWSSFYSCLRDPSVRAYFLHFTVTPQEQDQGFFWLPGRLSTQWPEERLCLVGRGYQGRS